MKKLYIAAIILGLIAFIGIIIISSLSENIPEAVKTVGFIVVGYIGIISFSYGWMKLHGKNNNK